MIIEYITINFSIAGIPRRISLKPKKRKSTLRKVASSDAPGDITVESLVALIQDPENGVPRASESALVNVQIHRGKYI